MKKLNVFVACERSGRVRDAFRALGHDAVSCDLYPSDAVGPHIVGDALTCIPPGTDLLIAFPDCTYLAASGMHWTTRGLRDPALTDRAVEFVRALMAAPVPRIAIENPIGVLSTRIRKPDQIIQPYQFGHDASKSTCLWLKGLPALKPTAMVEPRYVCRDCRNVGRDWWTACPVCKGGPVLYRWSNQLDSGQNRLGPSKDRARNRSRTYQGIADAMAQQWTPL